MVGVIECYSVPAYHSEGLWFDFILKICQYDENHMKKGAHQTFAIQCISKYLRLLTLFNITQCNLSLVKSCRWENYICYIDSLLFWKTPKFQNDSYEYIEHWKRDKLICLIHKKPEIFFLYCLLVVIFWKTHAEIFFSITLCGMFFMVVMKCQRPATMLKLYGSDLHFP